MWKLKVTATAPDGSGHVEERFNVQASADHAVVTLVAQRWHEVQSWWLDDGGQWQRQERWLVWFCPCIRTFGERFGSQAEALRFADGHEAISGWADVYGPDGTLIDALSVA
jgi:hypothetical protein